MLDYQINGSSKTQTNSKVVIPKELKEHACLLNGILYVVGEKRQSPICLNFVSRLKKLGELSKVQTVSFSELNEKKKQLRTAEKEGNRSFDDSELVQFAQNLFVKASQKNASDIHIRVHADFSDILMRIDGGLQHFQQTSAPFGRLLLSTIYQVLGEGDSASHPYYQPNTFQDARIVDAEYLPSNVHGIRIASGSKVGGNFMVLRLLYAETEEASGKLEDRLSDLGYSSLQTKAISYMRSRPTGINVIAGPTGSGKSTTLKHVMESISQERPDIHIMSVEDPPEYPIHGVIQMPVTNTEGNEERENAFSDAIRASLRSDPDIIMIGEIRDSETAKLAFRAAQTGHQVWTTIHANSAFGILSRLIDILSGKDMVDPYSYLSDSTIMTGLIFQKLVRTSCPYCKVKLLGNENMLSSAVLSRLTHVLDLSKTNVYLKGSGCKECNFTGIKGRTIVSETVAPDPEMLKILRQERSVEASRKHWVEKQEGKTYLFHAIEKIAKGALDPVETENVIGPLMQDIVFSDGLLEEEELVKLA